MNEALQQSLYDKLSREQDKYRDWLKDQPPEEILHHSYEYTVREDILMSMEELTLSEAETRALLLSPSPMAILYDKFSDLETGYMDTIRDSIENTARDEAKRLKELPVYPYPADHAREQGELDVYRASFRANVSCKEAIEAAIREHYRDNRLDAGAVGDVVDKIFLLIQRLYIVFLHLLDKRGGAALGGVIQIFLVLNEFPAGGEGLQQPCDEVLLLFCSGECTALIRQQLHAGTGGNVAGALGQLRGILSALEVGRNQYDPGHVSSGSMRRWLRTAFSKLT